MADTLWLGVRLVRYSSPFYSVGYYLLAHKKIGFLSATSNREDLEFVIKLAREGRIKPVIDRFFPLHETADAFKYIREHHAKGKVIIKIK